MPLPGQLKSSPESCTKKQKRYRRLTDFFYKKKSYATSSTVEDQQNTSRKALSDIGNIENTLLGNNVNKGNPVASTARPIFKFPTTSNYEDENTTFNLNCSFNALQTENVSQSKPLCRNLNFTNLSSIFKDNSAQRSNYGDSQNNCLNLLSKDKNLENKISPQSDSAFRNFKSTTAFNEERIKKSYDFDKNYFGSRTPSLDGNSQEILQFLTPTNSQNDNKENFSQNTLILNNSQESSSSSSCSASFHRNKSQSNVNCPSNRLLADLNSNFKEPEYKKRNVVRKLTFSCALPESDAYNLLKRNVEPSSRSCNQDSIFNITKSNVTNNISIRNDTIAASNAQTNKINLSQDFFNSFPSTSTSHINLLQADNNSGNHKNVTQETFSRFSTTPKLQNLPQTGNHSDCCFKEPHTALKNRAICKNLTFSCALPESNRYIPDINLLKVPSCQDIFAKAIRRVSEPIDDKSQINSIHNYTFAVTNTKESNPPNNNQKNEETFNVMQDSGSKLQNLQKTNTLKKFEDVPSTNLSQRKECDSSNLRNPSKRKKAAVNYVEIDSDDEDDKVPIKSSRNSQERNLSRLSKSHTDPISNVQISRKSNQRMLSELDFENSAADMVEWETKLIKGMQKIREAESIAYEQYFENFEWNLIPNEQEIIKRISDALEKCKETGIIKIRKITYENCLFHKGRLLMKPSDTSDYHRIILQNRISSKTFELINDLLLKIKSLMEAGSSVNQRELYYQLANSKQKKCAQVWSAVNEISRILDVGPWEFAVFKTSKGLVYGELNIFYANDEVINCNVTGGVLIPQKIKKIKRFETKAEFIIVVEKDTIFQKLLDDNFQKLLPVHFILVTGKGYPDTNTRLFLNKIYTTLKLPIFILTDANPHGIDIMLCYRTGALETAHLSHLLAIPNLHWLGVFPSEINTLNLTKQNLTQRDYVKINSILQRNYMKHFPKIQEELIVLKKNGVKSEIEGVLKSDEFLSKIYLPMKFYNSDYL